ncbi:hypothetical protein PoB_006121000 [Plakobranchus ocellatus]|uniref:Uncharacterized protein n=1 Tax=Plakobranchus ocellatus TaxID=259542 RepID=A0AAV4CS93_9GAST|nr:hypothetical protein PoB_006121000 [Plakobranchus ocellatus]
MLATLLHQDLVTPDVKTRSLTYGWTGRPLASHIAIAVFVTLLCRHVYLPWLRPSLQELKTCSLVCLPWHSGHVGSSFIPHRIRFEGRRSYTAPIRKLILSGAMCYISFHIRYLCNAPSDDPLEIAELLSEFA